MIDYTAHFQQELDILYSVAYNPSGAAPGLTLCGIEKYIIIRCWIYYCAEVQKRAFVLTFALKDALNLRKARESSTEQSCSINF